MESPNSQSQNLENLNMARFFLTLKNDTELATLAASGGFKTNIKPEYCEYRNFCNTSTNSFCFLPSFST